MFRLCRVSKKRISWQCGAILGLLLTGIPAQMAIAAPTFQQVGTVLTMSNGNVLINYDLSAGTADFYWQNSKKISAFYSAVTLSSGYVRGIDFSNRSWSVTGSNQVAVTA